MGAVRGADEPLGPPGNLGDVVVTEMLEHAIEHGRYRWERAELLDQIVAGRFCFGIGDGRATFVEHRPGPDLTGVVTVRRHLLNGKCTLQIVDDRFSRGKVEVELGPFVRREFA